MIDSGAPGGKIQFVRHPRNLFTTYFAGAAGPVTLSRQKKGIAFFALATYRSKLTAGMPTSIVSLTAAAHDKIIAVATGDNAWVDFSVIIF